MNYGYVKVAAAVPGVKVADCAYNADCIIEQIKQAEEKGVEIVCFPELSITAYSCGDLFAQQLLLDQAELALMKLLERPIFLTIRNSTRNVGSPVLRRYLRLQSGSVDRMYLLERKFCLKHLQLPSVLSFARMYGLRFRQAPITLFMEQILYSTFLLRMKSLGRMLICVNC